MKDEAPDISELLEAIVRMRRVLGMAALYLEHEDVAAMPFAVRSVVAAETVRREMEKATDLLRRDGNE